MRQNVATMWQDYGKKGKIVVSCNFSNRQNARFYADCQEKRIFSGEKEKNFFQKNLKKAKNPDNSIMTRVLDDFANYIVLQSFKIAGHFYYNCKILTSNLLQLRQKCGKASSRTIGNKC